MCLLIVAHSRLKQRDHEFETSLSYIGDTIQKRGSLIGGANV